MRATIDGTIEFDQLELKVESWRRDTTERNIAGLDGVLSVDMGLRGREVFQKGVLRAVSDEAIYDKLKNISALMDGQSHSLVLSDGRIFNNLRVDLFEADEKCFSGMDVWCEFSILYTQLRT